MTQNITGRALLELHLNEMNIGEEHKSRIRRLNPDPKPGDSIRGLRITGRREAVRIFRGWVPKSHVFRVLGPHARDFWAEIEDNHREHIQKIGRRKYLPMWIVRNAVGLTEGNANG